MEVFQIAVFILIVIVIIVWAILERKDAKKALPHIKKYVEDTCSEESEEIKEDYIRQLVYKTEGIGGAKAFEVTVNKNKHAFLHLKP